MRLIKMFGLAAVAAVAAMAFVGATSASATSTALCTVHDGLTCDTGTLATTVSMLGSGILLASPVNVLCLHVEGSASVLALGNPQSVHVTLLDFNECGTKASHENCEVVVITLPLSNLLKLGLDHGTLTATNGRTLVECENIDIFGTDLHCEYDATGLQFLVGAQHLTANETPVTEIGSDFLCPNNPTLDGLLVTTANRYVLA